MKNTSEPDQFSQMRQLIISKPLFRLQEYNKQILLILYNAHTVHNCVLSLNLKLSCHEHI